MTPVADKSDHRSHAPPPYDVRASHQPRRMLRKPRTLSSLERLPIGVTPYLFGLLPLSSLAILARTSRALRLAILSITDPFARLGRRQKAFERAKFSFLSFGPEYPNHIICYACGVFHRRNEGTTKSTNQTIAKCKRHGSQSIVVSKGKDLKDYLVRSFTWLKIHETMRSLRYSPRYGSTLLNHVGAKRDSSW
jgi:hypothetical protein